MHSAPHSRFPLIITTPAKKQQQRFAIFSVASRSFAATLHKAKYGHLFIFIFDNPTLHFVCNMGILYLANKKKIMPKCSSLGCYITKAVNAAKGD